MNGRSWCDSSPHVWKDLLSIIVRKYLPEMGLCDVQKDVNLFKQCSIENKDGQKEQIDKCFVIINVSNDQTLILDITGKCLGTPEK